jgi:hypothetical protein
MLKARSGAASITTMGAAITTPKAGIEITSALLEETKGFRRRGGMLANGMQQAIVLRPRATTLADRLDVIRLWHCTEKTVANETSIVVDAATKAGPMCKLIADCAGSAKSGGGDGQPIGSPHLRQGVPTTWYFGWLHLAACRRHSQW